ncbi:MAG TPA: septum formation initiator family protein [Myxococcota bacterium]|nr:septum formation initiator family protein [Myxococcota bacterium]
MRRLLLVPLVLCAVLLWAFLDEKTGIRSWLSLRSELARSEARIAVRRQEVEALRAEAEALRNDPLAIEGAIREDLGLAKPGEIVIKFPKKRDDRGETPRLP